MRDGGGKMSEMQHSGVLGALAKAEQALHSVASFAASREKYRKLEWYEHE